MPLSVELQKVIQAQIVWWEIDGGACSIAWTLADGSRGVDLVGSKAEAEAIVKTINTRNPNVIDLVTAARHRRRSRQ